MTRTAVASDDRYHKCPGCGAPDVPNKLFACAPCWWRLPLAMRQKILFTHRAGPAAALDHRLAMRDAALWYDQQRTGA